MNTVGRIIIAYSLLVTVPLGAIAQEETPQSKKATCEKLLLKTTTKVSVVSIERDVRGIAVTLTAPTKPPLECDLLPRKNSKIIERWVSWKANGNVPTVPELTAWLSHPWALLAQASARRLVSLSKTQIEKFDEASITSLVSLARDQELSLRITSACVSVLSQLAPERATAELTTVLERARQTGAKMSAARALARIVTDGAKRALNACAKRKERTISLFCEKQVVLWAARKKANLTP